MATRLWFAKNTARRIIIRSYAGLVGKAPTKEKRIKILCTMPLTGKQNKLTGLPEWLADGRDFVMKTGQVVKPPTVIPYCNIVMDDSNLFQKTPIEAPKSRISHFSIENMGSEEDPDTVVKFQILTRFSTDLLRWVGQMAGEEFDVKFELTEAPEEDEGGDEDEEGEAEADAALKEDEPDDEQVRQRKRREERAAIAKADKNLKLM